MSNTTTMIRTLATTITFIILTVVIITPSTALALNGNNKNIDLDGANVKTLVNENTIITPHDNFFARVKPQLDLKVTTASGITTI